MILSSSYDLPAESPVDTPSPPTDGWDGCHRRSRLLQLRLKRPYVCGELLNRFALLLPVFLNLADGDCCLSKLSTEFLVLLYLVQCLVLVLAAAPYRKHVLPFRAKFFTHLFVVAVIVTAYRSEIAADAPTGLLFVLSDVPYVHSGYVDLVACFDVLQREVQVVEVHHAKALLEPESLVPHHPTQAVDRRNFCHPPGRNVVLRIVTHFHERGVYVIRTVLVDGVPARESHQAHVLAPFHELDNMVEPPLIVYEQVVVQDRHVFAFGEVQALIDRFDGAVVFLVFDVVQWLEVLYELRVVKPVVHYDKRVVVCDPRELLEHPARIFLAVIQDNDYRNRLSLAGAGGAWFDFPSHLTFDSFQPAVTTC